MGMHVVLDGMVHTTGIHRELGVSMGIGGTCATGGQEVTPTDLVALGLSSCILTMLGKAAQARSIDLTGTWAETSYALRNYRLASFTVAVYSPAELCPTVAAELEAASHDCPIHIALKDSVDIELTFIWGSQQTPAEAKSCCAPKTSCCAPKTTCCGDS